jgi:hypothetical protein
MMGKNLMGKVCGCGELVYYGQTVCSECEPPNTNQLYSCVETAADYIGQASDENKRLLQVIIDSYETGDRPYLEKLCSIIVDEITNSNTAQLERNMFEIAQDLFSIEDGNDEPYEKWYKYFTQNGVLPPYVIFDEETKGQILHELKQQLEQLTEATDMGIITRDMVDSFYGED